MNKILADLISTFPNGQLIEYVHSQMKTMNDADSALVYVLMNRLLEEKARVAALETLLDSYKKP